MWHNVSPFIAYPGGWQVASIKKAMDGSARPWLYNAQLSSAHGRTSPAIGIVTKPIGPDMLFCWYTIGFTYSAVHHLYNVSMSVIGKW